MEKVLLRIITASGLCVVSSHVGHQYHFVYELKNMTEAQSYCREQYTDLATVDNMEDVRILNNMADLSRMASSGNQAWIGLYDDTDSWRWSLADKMFYKDEEAEFRNWKVGQPDNYRSGENCATMQDRGHWNDDRCENINLSVCLDIRGPNVTFVLVNKSMNWTEAQSYCRKHHTDLASVRNTAENQEVKELVPAGQTVWIGLFRDSWKWSDGSNSSFRYWTAVEPNNRVGKEDCVAADFSQSGKWEDWNCHWKKAFICFSAIVSKQVLKVRLMKESSSLDLNHPAVMEDILKQLKQRLKDQGVNGDVKLRWRKQADGKVFHKEEKKKKKRRRNTSTKKDEL